MIAPLIEHPGSVTDALPTLKMFCYCWVVFPSLELLVWVNVGVGIVQAHYHTDKDQLRYTSKMNVEIYISWILCGDEERAKYGSVKELCNKSIWSDLIYSDRI